MTVDNYGSKVVSACESVWSAIRERHADLPEVVITIGDGNGKIWGYFSPKSWHATDDRTGQHQMLLAAERLQHGPEGVLETILHESVHALAQARGIKDTTRQGRYHNKRFMHLAHSIGLRCEKMDDTHGFAKTDLSDELRHEYARQLHDLEQALHYYKRNPLKSRAKKSPTPKAQCDCGRKVPSAYLPIICGDCRTDFQEENQP